MYENSNLTKEDFEIRLHELSKLEFGWIEDGRIVSKAAFESARNLVHQFMAFGMQYPYIYPTPQGGLQLEWSDDKHNCVNIKISRTGGVKIYF